MSVRIQTFSFCKTLWSGSPDWDHTGVVVTHSKSEYSCDSFFTCLLIFVFFFRGAWGRPQDWGFWGYDMIQTSPSEYK